MQVTKGTWRMHEQCVPGSLSSSPAQEPGNEANGNTTWAKKLRAWMVLFLENIDLIQQKKFGYWKFFKSNLAEARFEIIQFPTVLNNAGSLFPPRFYFSAFLHNCEIKSGSGLGTRLYRGSVITSKWFEYYQ